MVPAEGVELRALITNKESGIIIGKGGANISKIREESVTFISIQKNEGAIAPERVLKVKGACDGLVKAFLLITSLLTQESKSYGGAEGSVQNVQFKLLIHKNQAGAIIGKGGATVNEIKQRSGAHIQLSNECLGASTDKSTSISGPLESVHSALEMIIPKLVESPLKSGVPNIPYTPGSATGPAPSPGGFGGYGAPASFGYQQQFQQFGQIPPTSFPQQPTPSAAALSGPKGEEKIAIPSSSAGAVIGKGGSIITQIKQQSGCHISIENPESPTSKERIVKIIGTQPCREAAIAMIQARVDPPSGGSGATILASTLTGETSEKLAIPSAVTGAVIGKGGSVINDIKNQSGAHIRISDNDGSAERIVNISGSSQAIQVALFLIKQRVEAAQSGTPVPQQLSMPAPRMTIPYYGGMAQGMPPQGLPQTIPQYQPMYGGPISR